MFIVSQWDRLHKGARGSERGERNEKCVSCVCVCAWRRATWVLSRGGEISREGLGAGDPFLKIHPAGRTLLAEDLLKPPSENKSFLLWIKEEFPPGCTNGFDTPGNGDWFAPNRELWNLFFLPALRWLTYTFSPRTCWIHVRGRRYVTAITSQRDGLRYILCIWRSSFQQTVHQHVKLISDKSSLDFLSDLPKALCGNAVLKSFWESSQYFTLAWKLLQEFRGPVGNITFINRAERRTPSSTFSVLRGTNTFEIC